jgi:oligopeptide/dipeptide ABC transporter ATP-binding protein
MIGSGINWAADGTWKLNTDYATSIKVTKDTPTTVDVQINPKAVWSDGTPITADDMISYWKAQNGTNKKFNVAGTTCFENIKDVKQVGSDKQHYTVDFNGAYAARIFAEPKHPYTKALMSAVPIPDPEVERTRRRILLEGDLPSPVEDFTGCRFAGRCPLYLLLGEEQQRRCHAEDPQLHDAGGTSVACHFTDRHELIRT